MKNAISVILTSLLVIFLSIIFESCKKDPIEKAKSDLFKKLEGSWLLTDYTSTESSGYNVLSYGSRWDTWTLVFSNNIITCTHHHSECSIPYAPWDTTIITSYGYTKFIDFTKYKNDNIYYTESTTTSGNSSIRDNYVSWIDLTIDNVFIRIEDLDCKITLDDSENLIITYDYSFNHISGGSSSHKKWIFRKE